MRAGLGPQVTAQKIAALARQRAQDRDRQTPFSTAAQDAGFRYYGGKLDDITVVVSYIASSKEVRLCLSCICSLVLFFPNTRLDCSYQISGFKFFKIFLQLSFSPIYLTSLTSCEH